MAHISDLIANDIEAYLKKHEHKSLLRFITCGSVDDGKSTLIGRLLYESKMIFEDHLRALQAESKKFGTQGDRLDFALLVDGLAAEREQGITIDVAYRFFSTDQRKFIVADTPGHEQYTRNMVTGASTADLAIVLVDARKGVLTQTKRHTTLVNLVGIQEIGLAVNKMDLIGYRREVFEKIVEDYRAFAALLGIIKFTAIPISALEGDNITTRSIAMDWYSGPTLMGYLESVPIDIDAVSKKPMRFPVQWVNRPNQHFRGYAGSLASGSLKKGDAVRVMPSGQETKIKAILLYNESLPKAVAGQSITVTLEDEIDISRGDILCDPKSPPQVSDQFEAKLVWMAQEPLHTGRSFRLKCGTKTVNATVTKIKYQLNVNTLEKLAVEKLDLNAVAVCNLSTDTPLVFDPYLENKITGSFIFIDQYSHHTLAAGLITHSLRRGQNIHPQSFSITKTRREERQGHAAKVIWLTGLSGAGKSTLANALEVHLHDQGKNTFLLDGDNIRKGLNKDLGFTTTDRIENIRRIAEVAALMMDAGLIVITTSISPFRNDREMAKRLIGKDHFVEVFVDTSLSVCERRDPKGLYRKARLGQIPNMTGIDSPYEPPLNPTVYIDGNSKTSQKQLIEKIELILKKNPNGTSS